MKAINTVAAVMNSNPPTSISTKMTALPNWDQNSVVSTIVSPVTVEAEIAVKKATLRLAAASSAAAIGRASIAPPITFSSRNVRRSSSGVEDQRRGGTRCRRMGIRTGSTRRTRHDGLSFPDGPSTAAALGSLEPALPSDGTFTWRHGTLVGADIEDAGGRNHSQA